MHVIAISTGTEARNFAAIQPYHIALIENRVYLFLHCLDSREASVQAGFTCTASPTVRNHALLMVIMQLLFISRPWQ